jgi:hypothetical protein
MCGKRCPLKGVMADGAPRECTFFLRHRQGHRLPVHVRSRPIHDAGGAIIGAGSGSSVVIRNAGAAGGWLPGWVYRCGSPDLRGDEDPARVRRTAYICNSVRMVADRPGFSRCSGATLRARDWWMPRQL